MTAIDGDVPAHLTLTLDLSDGGGAVVTDMPHEDYLRHPALSASGAKLLVQPGGPAKFAHRLEHPEPPRDAFDLGHAAHRMVLGVGAELVVVQRTIKATKTSPELVVDADDYKTASAQEHRDAIRADGGVPILRRDLERVEDMATALHRHPLAGKLLHPTTGAPEVSLFWHDEQHGVDRRGRVDWLRTADPTGRLILVDYKTCTAADARALQSAVVRYGYHQQAAWYRDLVLGLDLATSAPFVFVFQETTAPYLVHVVELDEQLLLIGAERNELGLRLFADCTAAGEWPGYNDGGITLLSPPRWALYEHDDLVGLPE